MDILKNVTTTKKPIKTTTRYSRDLLFLNYVVAEFAKLDWQDDVALMSVYVIGPLGMLGNILTVIALLQKTYRKQENNSIFLFLSILRCSFDFMFHFLDLISKRILRDSLLTSKVKSQNISLQIVGATAASFSLASDLVSLTLVFNYYLSVCFPLRYKMWCVNIKLMKIFCVIFCIFLLSLSSTRMHYSLQTEDSTFSVVNLTENIGYFDTAPWGDDQSHAITGIVIDFVMPCIMVGLMIFFVGSILTVIRKRVRKTKPQALPLVNPYFEKNHNQTKVAGGESEQVKQSVTKFLIVNIVLFFVNEVSYITYSSLFVVGLINFSTIESDMDIKNWLDLQIVKNYVSCWSIVAEQLSHALTFYVYVIFNRTFRETCFVVAKKICF